jgi:hypothetical protein
MRIKMHVHVASHVDAYIYRGIQLACRSVEKDLQKPSPESTASMRGTAGSTLDGSPLAGPRGVASAA